MAILNRPLRVMHIISGDLWAGAEVQAFTLLQQLQPKVQLHVVILNDGELSKRLLTLNIPVTIVPESELSSWRILNEFKRLIREFQPDILHTHRQKENIFGSIANYWANLFRGKRAKSLRTTHGAPEFSPKGKQKIQVWLDNFVGNYLQHAIIAVSEELALKLSTVFSAKKIHTIRNGVNQAYLLEQAKDADFRSQYPQHIHIGIIGRVEPVKRIDIFLDAATLLIHQMPSPHKLKFHVIGDGSLKATMQAKAQQLGLSEHIQFHGHRQDMASCIKSLDIIVMCSDHEGTPMTALEAMALGTPLIAHDTGGLKDILQDYPQLLVTNHSPAGYAAQVSQVIANNNMAVTLPEKYTAAKNVVDTLILYKKLKINKIYLA